MTEFHAGFLLGWGEWNAACSVSPQLQLHGFKFNI